MESVSFFGIILEQYRRFFVKIDELLQIGLSKKASDLHIKEGIPPRFRVDGEVTQIISNVVTREIIKGFLENILTPPQLKTLSSNCDIDVLYVAEGIGRFRTNVFRENNTFAIVMRHIPTKIPAIDELRLPSVLKEIAMEPRGIVLVTGTTGSGKSTTLAAMINHINENTSSNIITVEDPVEFYHDSKKSIISQRSVGHDVPSFTHALKYVLRQDPDVILIGEMRDFETIQTAVTAAETGHLVFSTLHTTDASQTVERVLNMYPANLQRQIRQQLSLNLKAVISQRLIPLAIGNGRRAALEVLRSTPTVRKLLLEAEVEKLYPTMQGGETEGMQTFNQALFNMVQSDLITMDAAMEYSNRPEELKLASRIEHDS